MQIYSYYNSKKLINFLSILLASLLSANIIYADDITELSIAELMQTKVTTVSHSEQHFADTAAAVFVISQQDIERSGVTSIQEALRMAPGMEIGRIGSSKWAVGGRGLTSRFANKLLVMIDGRAIYTPTFSGTYWELNDMILEDIERIEVVRGPGSSIWGPNAVNGVVNIITKSTEKTQGALVSVLAGNQEKIASLRYGSQFNSDLNYRGYLKYTHRDAELDQHGNDAQDDWQQFRGGIRIDWQPDQNNEWQLLADIHKADINQSHLITRPRLNPGLEQVHNKGNAFGASIHGRWTHHLSVASKFTTQMYYQNFQRNDYLEDDERHTFNIDFKHELAFLDIHHLIWGAEYRLNADTSNESEILTVNPRKRTLHLFSAFIQDRILLWDEKIELTLGTKVSYHTFSKWQLLPSAKLLWKVHPKHRLWASVSRSTRTPSVAERDVTFKPLQLFSELPVDWVFTGSPVGPEKVITYEAGYRTWPLDNLSFDVTFFYAQYKDNIVFQLDDFNFMTGQITLAWNNAESTNVWGIEIANEWQASKKLQFNVAYSFVKTNLKIDEPDVNLPGVNLDRGDDISPNQQITLRAGYDIWGNVTLGFWYRYVDSIGSLTTSLPGINRSVDSYHAIDLRVAWKPSPQWQLSLVGQNLLSPSHTEYLEEVATFPSQIQRSVYAQVQWTY